MAKVTSVRFEVTRFEAAGQVYRLAARSPVRRTPIVAPASTRDEVVREAADEFCKPGAKCHGARNHSLLQTEQVNHETCITHFYGNNLVHIHYWNEPPLSPANFP